MTAGMNNFRRTSWCSDSVDYGSLIVQNDGILIVFYFTTLYHLAYANDRFPVTFYTWIRVNENATNVPVKTPSPTRRGCAYLCA